RAVGIDPDKFLVQRLADVGGARLIDGEDAVDALGVARVDAVVAPGGFTDRGDTRDDVVVMALVRGSALQIFNHVEHPCRRGIVRRRRSPFGLPCGEGRADGNVEILEVVAVVVRITRYAQRAGECVQSGAGDGG